MVASRRWFARIHPSAAAALLPVEGELPALERATGWLNSPPLGTADLAGEADARSGEVSVACRRDRTERPARLIAGAVRASQQLAPSGYPNRPPIDRDAVAEVVGRVRLLAGGSRHADDDQPVRGVHAGQLS